MATAFDSKTTGSEVAARFAGEIKGKTVVITGVTPGGIGFAVTQAVLTQSPKAVVITARSESKLAETKAELAKAAPGVTIHTVAVDYTSFASVRAAAETIAKVGQIDVLINNAGVSSTPFKLTDDGHEGQWQINHFSTFLLTSILLPVLLQSKTPRIVNTSSLIQGAMTWDQFEPKSAEDCEPGLIYGQTKTANALHVIALADKFADKGLVAISLHPGLIPSNIMSGMAPSVAEQMAKLYPVFNDDLTPNLATGAWKTLEQGAATTLAAAFNPALKDHNGAFLADCQVAPLAEFATDKDEAKRLWEYSNKVVGITA